MKEKHVEEWDVAYNLGDFKHIQPNGKENYFLVKQVMQGREPTTYLSGKVPMYLLRELERYGISIE